MPDRRRLIEITLMTFWMLWLPMPGNALVAEHRPTAFIHANLIPMTTATVLPDQTVVVEGNRITTGHIPFQVGLDGVLAEGMNEIAHIEALLWEFSSMDRQRYFDSEGEWMERTILEPLCPGKERISSCWSKTHCMMWPIPARFAV
jgi:hypothetical protein